MERHRCALLGKKTRTSLQRKGKRAETAVGFTRKEMDSCPKSEGLYNRDFEQEQTVHKIFSSLENPSFGNDDQTSIMARKKLDWRCLMDLQVRPQQNPSFFSPHIYKLCQQNRQQNREESEGKLDGGFWAEKDGGFERYNL